MRAAVRTEYPSDDEQARRNITRAAGLDDFLTYRIPGTELYLGMSRRLFAACDQRR
ncbi:hypothetical protein [Streptomyces sp. TRM68367]|uniref:hypothetical protein n=1 Tax=Streptomyces sp. TRM68367 TaxID=2758415 RepID=UPI00165CB60D|nr:hypothetical protein [Streptomyces sp. TRM68367]MBC9727882.1 hypothetical protein [Streptomyces sp. TRM68367]